MLMTTTTQDTEVKNNEIEIQEEIKEVTKQELVRAAELKIYDEDQNHLKDFKAIVNEADHTRLFSIVTTQYKVVQHEEVVQAIGDSLDKLGFTPEQNIRQFNGGANIRVYLTFPDAHLRIGRDTLTLRMFWENSYNTTTALRLVIEGIYLKDNKQYAIYIDPKLYSRYNRRHTKGLMLDIYKNKTKHAFDCFMSEVKEQFEKMLATPMTLQRAIDFIDGCAENKVIAETYLKSIRVAIQKLTPDELDSQWLLYDLINRVLTENVKSLAQREMYLEKMTAKICK